MSNSANWIELREFQFSIRFRQCDSYQNSINFFSDHNAWFLHILPLLRHTHISVRAGLVEGQRNNRKKCGSFVVINILFVGRCVFSLHILTSFRFLKNFFPYWLSVNIDRWFSSYFALQLSIEQHLHGHKALQMNENDRYAVGLARSLSLARFFSLKWKKNLMHDDD